MTFNGSQLATNNSQKETRHMHKSRSADFLLQTKDMAQANQPESRRASGFRLQTSAYANRDDTTPASYSKFDLANLRLHFDFLHHTDAFMSSGYGNYSDIKPRGSLINYKSKQMSRSLLQLPVITTEDIAANTQHNTPPSSNDISSDELQKNAAKLSQNFNPLIPVHKSRDITARLSIAPAGALGDLKNKRRRFSLDDDSSRLAMKISLPCTGGCCYCAYTNLMGPVRIYVTRAEKPKKEPLLLRFKDGNGNPVIPVSRKSDVRGLVYDPICHNLHPPIRGQRSDFQAKKVKQPPPSQRQAKNR